MKCNKLKKLISVFLFLLITSAFLESASAHYDSCLGSCLSKNTDNSVTRNAASAGGKTLVGISIAKTINHLVDWFFPPVAAALPDPNQGPGGPILVIDSAASTFGKYYAEILRAEGMNAFSVDDITNVNAVNLANYDVVILASMSLSSAQVTMFTDWVNAGGNLVVMRPDAQLSSLLGLTAAGSTLTNAYLLVNTSENPGNGIVNQTMQFHGTADRYTLNGASQVAMLYSDAVTATTNPAVTLNNVGANGGQAAAFTYDLATSIVLMRQGNPAWVSQERDGFNPLRSDDMYFGNAAGDPQPDWVDFNKVAIPQADEQQRLLVNLITHMNLDKRPLPRFWYFPRGGKAVVVMTGDDHKNNGTEGRFDQYISLSQPGCSVEDWECVRGTSYIYHNTPITAAKAQAFSDVGFEIALHANTNCANYTTATLDAFYVQQLAKMATNFPTLPPTATQRQHCIAWSGWTIAAEVQFNHNIRFDTDYYFWPPSWGVGSNPGFMTGSGMPMRFADLNGVLIDVYQAATQMTDESGQQYPFTVDTLLDRALGEEGYYGAFVANAHTDLPITTESDEIVNSALARNVPIITSIQMMNWLDGRNSSKFSAITWTGNTLSFTVTPGADSFGTPVNGLDGLVPLNTNAGVLTSLTRDGNAVTYTIDPVKGIDYAHFAAAAGPYVATYGSDTVPPTVESTTPANGAIDVDQTADIEVVFDEAIDVTTINNTTLELRDNSNTLVNITVSYNPLSRKAVLSPSSLLAGNETYTVTVKGGTTDPRVKDVSGNALAANYVGSFTTASGPTCPCSGWDDSTIPTNPAVNDPNAIEVGVRFKTDFPGFITSIRFYKGTGNTGTHIVNLWTNTGELLATATATNETATGWQQVDLPNPVAITENTVYVASYFLPNGQYAADSFYFASNGRVVGPLTMLQDGVSGGNGVYKYGPSSDFPTSSFQATNYWVDVVFTINPGADTSPPQVTATTPVDNAIDVSPSTLVTVGFNEAIDDATITTSTVQLYDSNNNLVPASVAYDAGTKTATLTPASTLASSSTYLAVAKSGAQGIKDLAGNELVTDVTWTFTTSGTTVCPCSGWSEFDAPTSAPASDPNSVELGVKFRSDIDGYIKGIRFYKGTGNTGTHIGNLWSSTGANLATATFVGETASGWQQVDFPSPVPITANTTYVASYFAPNGNYSADSFYFQNSGVDNAPVHLLQEGVSGSNGVYVYGASSGAYPNKSVRSTNYWVDVVFITDNGPDTTPPTITSTTPVDAATGVLQSIAVSAQFNEAIDQATLTSSSFSLSDSVNPAVAATVTYNASTNTATLQPNAPLALDTSYTAVIDTTVTDSSGNALAANFSWSFTTTGGSVCDTPANPVVAENCMAGNPSTEWDISGVGDTSIQGFSTDISVNKGQTVSFKIDTDATNYSLDIYRMGYYGGMGAREIATVQPQATLPQNQPACLNDAATGLVDCGNWQVSASWDVPANATSGIYFAKVIRADTNGASHIFFIVRDDASNADMLFQTSDTTWQSYNTYGGNSLYAGSPVGRAYKVSYNRPFNTRSVASGVDWVFHAEYPMVRWLEANGYDVTYATGVDSDRLGNLVQNHKVFLSVGHDEYWSGTQRDNIEAARAAGVNLAFFSGNEAFWKIRWENSIDASGTPYRTLVCYKETHANAVIDPANPIWTGTWRDPRFSPPADGGRPENELTGTIFTVNGNVNSLHNIKVPDTDGKMRFWRNTDIANQAPGATVTLPLGTLGYEWDEDLDNGARPAGLIRMSTNTVNNISLLQDYGSTYASGTATHHLTLYRHASDALVFGAGTIQWSWGLDSNHDNGSAAADVRMQQATVNLFADMNVQPATLQAGLSAAAASSDFTAPVSTITAPASGTNFNTNDIVTITGTATDTGGGVVGGVEVSVDGGINWHPANGRENWSYQWNVAQTGSVNIKSRAVDDSGNIELPGAGVNVTVGSAVCPCSIWNGITTPANPSENDSGSVEVGVKFTTDVDGFITSVLFYKGTGNTGTHVGNLWDSAGNLLASATFVNETSEGWQRVDFSTPVAVTAGTVYVASYLAPNGHYAADSGYFATAGVENGPLNALQDGVSGGNGVYIYSAASAFPTNTWQSANYWIDVVFTEDSSPDTTPPTVINTTPADLAIDVAQGTTVTAVFSEDLAAATVTGSNFTLTDGVNAVAATVTYDAPSKTAILTPNSLLTANATYTATLTVGITDVAGNPLAAEVSWSFTVGSTDTVAPTVTNTTPADLAIDVAQGTTVTAVFSEDLASVTVNGSNFTLSDGVNAVAATVTYDAPSKTAILTPDSLLTASTTYTATLTIGITDVAGNPLAAEVSWSFTVGSTDTVAPTVTNTTPADLAIDVAQGTTVTAVFNEDLAAATVTGSNFTLTDGVNAVAATVTYDAPSKTAILTPNSLLTANTTYTATLTVGITDVAGNPLAAEVSWSFTVGSADTVAPTVTNTTPADLATGVALGTTVTAVFSEDLASATVNGSNFTLTDGVNAVSATVTYDAPSKTAILSPNSLLTANATYTATLTVGITDVAGNPLAAEVSWSFTTAAGSICPCSVWSAADTPANPSENDSGSVEVGVKFTTDVDGVITSVLFYKGTGNTGTHVGNLWDSNGTLLASANFVNETAEGWQRADFSTPVAVTAGTVYVASYLAPNGHYAADSGYFAAAGVENGPLNILQDGVSGGNSVYIYTAASAFPTNTWQSANYWVDVVFE